MTRLLPRIAPRQYAFTLIELLVGIALVSVVLAFGGAVDRDLMGAQRVSAINAELVTDLQFARSEAVRRNRPVGIEFRSSSTQTCYSIFLSGAAVVCNCLRGVGRACGIGSPNEIKTVLLPRQTDISFAASSGLSAGVTFDKPDGIANPGDFSVDVASTRRGLLRTSTNMTGRPTVCSPDGSVSQVLRCPE